MISIHGNLIFLSSLVNNDIPAMFLPSLHEQSQHYFRRNLKKSCQVTTNMLLFTTISLCVSKTLNPKLSNLKVICSLIFPHLYIWEIKPLLIPCKVSACIGWLSPTVYSYFLLMSFPPAGYDLWPVIYLL